jgi:hypothetical protein
MVGHKWTEMVEDSGVYVHLSSSGTDFMIDYSYNVGPPWRAPINDMFMALAMVEEARKACLRR